MEPAFFKMSSFVFIIRKKSTQVCKSFFEVNYLFKYDNCSNECVML